MRLVLASASPRRAELLTSAGFTFETLVVDVDERPRPGEAAPAYVRRLAGEKSARALDLLSCSSETGAGSRKGAYYPQGPPEGGYYVQGADDVADLEGPRDGGHHGTGGSRTVRDIVVLGADTAVVLDGEILGKPRDDEDARTMLRRLSGQRHEVLTGVSLRTVGEDIGLVEATSVWFTSLTLDAITWYISTGEGRDTAGAYAIQGLASRFIPRIDGSYSNVVGLPVAAVADLLQKLKGRRPG
jgi:nucleoside triphosphate pyrophosphatase